MANFCIKNAEDKYVMCKPGRLGSEFLERLSDPNLRSLQHNKYNIHCTEGTSTIQHMNAKFLRVILQKEISYVKARKTRICIPQKAVTNS